MKRVWRFSSDAVAQAELFCLHSHGIPLPKPIFVPPYTTTSLRASPSYAFTRQFCTLSSPRKFDIVSLFTAKRGVLPQVDLINKASILRSQLLHEETDSARVVEILNDNFEYLIESHISGSMFLELLNQLGSKPSLALEVFNWRRKLSVDGNEMGAYEYSKGIKAAGRLRNIDLAVELFKEAERKGIKTTSTYNALMGAYMFNGLADRCQSLFCDMKKESICIPSIATYNTLISVFGRLLLVDHMEATYQEINKLELPLGIKTYNHLISGYIAAWMWDDMEKVFQMLKEGPVMPDLNTFLLMLRGYALSGNLEKMEETYTWISDLVNEKHKTLIRCMICAYCKSSDTNRIKKIEKLLKFIPQEEYRSWLNVLLIRLYAQEDRLEEMENEINEAFKHKTTVITRGIMNGIITCYYRSNAIDKLETFVKRAEYAGWKVCRSLYHCKMVMYGSEKRLEEMHSVLSEMEYVNLCCTKKTLWIMYRVYLSCGQRSLVFKILGQMFKHGYEVPLKAFPS